MNGYAVGAGKVEKTDERQIEALAWAAAPPVRKTAFACLDQLGAEQRTLNWLLVGKCCCCWG